MRLVLCEQETDGAGQLPWKGKGTSVISSFSVGLEGISKTSKLLFQLFLCDLYMVYLVSYSLEPTSVHAFV